MSSQTGLKIPQDSPKFHPLRVKLGKQENTVNINTKQQLSLKFHPFTPTPSRIAIWAIFRVYARGGGEKGET